MTGSWPEQYAALMHKNFLITKRSLWEWFVMILMPLLLLCGIYLLTTSSFVRFVQGNLIELSLTLSIFGYQRSIMIKEVNERSGGFREYFKIMGLREGDLTAANLTYSYVVCTISFSIMLFGVVAKSYLHFENLTYSLLNAQLLFIIAAINFTFTISLSFRSVKTAGDVGILIILSLFLLTVTQLFLNESWIFYLFCWIPQIAYLSAISSQRSEQIVGILILFAQSLIYFLLYFYFDQIIPNAHGIQKHPLFFLNNIENKQQQDAQKRDESQIELLNNNLLHKTSAFYENNVTNKNKLPIIYISKLTKRFDSFCAIDAISFGVYDNEVLCLLGHNGAGKTTLINMLCNIYKPTSGSIFYEKHNIVDDNEIIRGKIGYCSQTDYLYDNITVLEHLNLMAKIKGVKKQTDIDEIAKKIGVIQYYKFRSKELSGGFKRKTCLYAFFFFFHFSSTIFFIFFCVNILSAMALLGKPHMIFLDEPTSGLDPVSRRSFWDIIYQIKHEKNSIILTTHHLEEAEALSDKLAIISRGRLLIYGSSQYVKSIFSEGYTVTMTFEKGNCSSSELEERMRNVKKLINSHIKNVKYNLQTSKYTMICMLPYSEMHNFSKLFEQLEAMKSVDISINQNTLEETFILIGEKEEEVLIKHGISAPDGYQKEKKIKLDINRVDEFFTLKQKMSFLLLVVVIFKKRLLIAIRDPAFYFILIIPIFILSLLVWLKSFYIVTEIVLPMEEFSYDQYISISYYVIIFSYTIFSSLYMHTCLKEREIGIRQLLRMSGCGATPYFLGNFLADLVIHFISFCLIYCLICIMWIFSDSLAIRPDTKTTSIFILLNLLFGCGFITYSYVLSFLFEKTVSGLQFFNLTIYGIFIGINIVFSLVQLFYEFDPKFLNILYIFEELISPLNLWYEIGGMIGFKNNILFEIKYNNPLLMCAIAVIQTICFFLVSLFLENNKYKIAGGTSKITSNRSDHMKSSSVVAEMRRVGDTSRKFLIKIENLFKKYFSNNGSDTYAVSDLTLGVESDSIFGLLGPNGAGKSTIFNILTSQIPKTSGKIQMNNIDFDNDAIGGIYNNVGLCSQNNIYWDNLTVYEHLALFAEIKGLPTQKINYISSYLMNLMTLQDYRYKKAEFLSGGNKRKLCVCMAIISNPQILFLDEPSTGVDAIARKSLWDTIKLTKSINKSSVILTTHALYEAESLCDRVGILINGMFQCVGSVQELKNMYGGGYQLILKTKSERCQNKLPKINIVQEVLTFIPESQQQQISIENEMAFNISNNKFKFNELFKKMEEWKTENLIDDYCIKENTLEHVFMELCKYQRNNNVQNQLILFFHNKPLTTKQND